MCRVSLFCDVMPWVNLTWFERGVGLAVLWCVREGAVKQFPSLVMTVKRKRTKAEEERVTRCCYCCEIRVPKGRTGQDRVTKGKQGQGPGPERVSCVGACGIIKRGMVDDEWSLRCSLHTQAGTNNEVHTISRDLRDAGTLSTVCAVVKHR